MSYGWSLLYTVFWVLRVILKSQHWLQNTSSISEHLINSKQILETVSKETQPLIIKYLIAYIALAGKFPRKQLIAVLFTFWMTYVESKLLPAHRSVALINLCKIYMLLLVLNRLDSIFAIGVNLPFDWLMSSRFSPILPRVIIRYQAAS